MKTPLDPWFHLTAAARHAAATQPAEDTTMPLGFATRVVAQWRAAQENPTFVFWQRWSLRGACAALVAYALVAAWSGQTTASGISVLDIPELPNL